MIELHGTFQAWLQQQKDQVVNLDSYSPKPLQCQKIPICYDDEKSSTPLRDIIISELPSCIAITPVLSTKKPKDSVIMGDEHLDTIPEKESDEFIKSSVENLVQTQVSSRMNIDSLLDEFAGELILLKSIPPGIDEADCDPEEELIMKFLYDNLSPHPLEEINSKNSDAIDLSLTPDDSMPPGIENDDYDSEGDILILEEFLSNDPLSLPENELFHFDIPSSPLPPAKPPDDDEIKPNLRILTVKVGLKAFQLSSKSPMMIYGGNIPILDVPFLISILLDQLKNSWILKTRARGFVLRSLDLHFLSFIWEFNI
nr:hypothetical protein [Tanacetum cinerariifolium]